MKIDIITSLIAAINTDMFIIFTITLAFIVFTIFFSKYLPNTTIRKFLTITMLFTKNTAIRKHMSLVIEIMKVLEKIENLPITSTNEDIRKYVDQTIIIISNAHMGIVLDYKTKEIMIDAIIPIITNKESIERKAVEITKLLIVRLKK